MIRAALLAAAAVAAAGDVAVMRPRPVEWAQPMLDAPVANCFKVSDTVYRASQPDEKGLKALEQFGIRSVLNLREHHNDDDEAEGTRVRLYRMEMEAEAIDDKIMEEALVALARAEKPVLVHCWHGSDRTGAVIALYRMVFEGWSREKAIDEFKNGGFGYHAGVYPGIETYLYTADIRRLKKAVDAARAHPPPAAPPPKTDP